MVKKLMLLLAIAMLFCSCALADVQVIDDAHLFSASEIESISDVIDRIERNHQMDMVVLTTTNTPTDYSESLYRVRDYADDFYDQGGYGMGEDFSGMLFLIDMNNRVMWISTGGVMIEYINDSREEAILDAAEMYVRNGMYGTAAQRAMEQTECFLIKGREEGTFLYDEATGKRLGGIYNALTSAEMGVGLIAGVIAAAIMLFSVKGSYSLSGSTYSYDLEGNSSVVLTQDEKRYLRQHVTRRARTTSTSSGGRSGGSGFSGGSGVHRSSAGRSHGGGGRRF